MTAEKKSEAGFEQDLEKLEAIVQSLEEGGLPLDTALKQFESGIQLARKCEKALRQAEQKIEMLVRNMDGEMEAEPYNESTAKAVEDAPKPKRASTKKTAPPVNEPPAEEEPPDEVYEEDGEDMDALF